MPWTSDDAAVTLFTFDRPDEAEWIVVNDGVMGGRSSGFVSRRACVPTTAEWVVVRVPFRALRSSIFGQPVNAPPINLARIRSVGLYMLDGRDGPFRVEVDAVRSYREDQ